MSIPTLNASGKLLVVDRPLIMGILNATPDSFYNKGRQSSPEALIEKAENMVEEGAMILDIGGTTTKPGAEEVSEQVEWDRIRNILKAIRQRFPDIFISIDTYRSGIAQKAAGEGADIINDISAGAMDINMIGTVARLGLPYIAMHMQGTPKIMQKQPQYKNVVQDILSFFIQKLRQCEAAGIRDVIIDPGFGFGKTVAHNFELLKGLHQLSITQKIILAGLSRKSMICRPLNISPDAALNGTTALHMLALQQGARILRVHDVKEAKECIALWELFKTTGAAYSPGQM